MKEPVLPDFPPPPPGAPLHSHASDAPGSSHDSLDLPDPPLPPLPNKANPFLQKGIGFVRKRGQRGIRQIQGIMRGARCIGSMGMQGGAWRWRRKVWKNGFLHER